MEWVICHRIEKVAYPNVKQICYLDTNKKLQKCWTIIHDFNTLLNKKWKKSFSIYKLLECTNLSGKIYACLCDLALGLGLFFKLFYLLFFSISIQYFDVDHHPENIHT